MRVRKTRVLVSRPITIGHRRWGGQLLRETQEPTFRWALMLIQPTRGRGELPCGALPTDTGRGPTYMHVCKHASRGATGGLATVYGFPSSARESNEDARVSAHRLRARHTTGYVCERAGARERCCLRRVGVPGCLRMGSR